MLESIVIIKRFQDFNLFLLNIGVRTVRLIPNTLFIKNNHQNVPSLQNIFSENNLKFGAPCGTR